MASLMIWLIEFPASSGVLARGETAQQALDACLDGTGYQGAVGASGHVDVWGGDGDGFGARIVRLDGSITGRAAA